MLGKVICCLIFFVAAMSPLRAQDEPTAAAGVEIVVDQTAVRAIPLQRLDADAADIVIDGHLDEAIWGEQIVLGDYRVIEPDTLVKPAYATELKMFYTERGIYAAFDLEQPRETLVQRHAPRDSFDVNRDTIGLNLDSSGSGRYGYWVTLALGDGQMDGTVRRSWTQWPPPLATARTFIARLPLLRFPLLERG